MHTEEIDVYIDAEGEVRIEVHCVPGAACQDLTRPLEDALGGEIVSRELTAEAYAQASTEATADQHVRRAS